MWNKDEVRGKGKQVTGAIKEKVGVMGHRRQERRSTTAMDTATAQPSAKAAAANEYSTTAGTAAEMRVIPEDGQMLKSGECG